MECLDDILSELGHVIHNLAYPQFSGSLKTSVTPLTVKDDLVIQAALSQPEKTHPLLQQMGYDPIHPDTLAQQSELSASDIYALLTEWELEGWWQVWLVGDTNEFS